MAVHREDCHRTDGERGAERDAQRYGRFVGLTKLALLRAGRSSIAASNTDKHFSTLFQRSQTKRIPEFEWVHEKTASAIQSGRFLPIVRHLDGRIRIIGARTVATNLKRRTPVTSLGAQTAKPAKKARPPGGTLLGRYQGPVTPADSLSDPMRKNALASGVVTRKQLAEARKLLDEKLSQNDP
jgi:hypothetical protein